MISDEEETRRPPKLSKARRSMSLCLLVYQLEEVEPMLGLLMAGSGADFLHTRSS